ncbi:GlsB/YeaQ/YmgE family stress response membrane protein [Chryseobacterium sp. CFBP8996]|jgi:uncharacterized membrane protein YeaQ/YmgE (transglycosylase-associated protein family)|uniref:GlsB/YeaQ/YmgE family stress response membrane protein n=1 Tax=Chryseobacterium TaxID=59732 RepID=UPI002A69DC18|nr:GlsB/YeaQ/YmgE family stress response membrane protein [Chryseobacterium sp. CFBP8996]MDY0933322.1 GlsB/YeaQ/YmgE family stress response membrane protein [Chryseobacterium sp. CFBP8996]
MEILAWIFVGLLVGIIAKLTSNNAVRNNDNFTIIFGIIGAVVAGVLLNITAIYYENLGSSLTIIAPISGAVLFLVLYRDIDRYR